MKLAKINKQKQKQKPPKLTTSGGSANSGTLGSTKGSETRYAEPIRSINRSR